MTTVPLEFTVPSDFDGHRLDRFLVSVLGGYSRSQIQKLIADGHVRSPPGAMPVPTSRCTTAIA